jgi:hypothetical protein
MAPPAMFMAPLDPYTTMMPMPTMPMAPPIDPVARLAATPMIFPPSNTYAMPPPAPVRGPSPQQQQQQQQQQQYMPRDSLGRSMDGAFSSSYGSSFAGRASADRFDAQQYGSGRFSNSTVRQDQPGREMRGGSSKHRSDSSALYAEKMADNIPSFSTAAVPVRAGGEEKGSVGGRPREQKEGEFASEGSQKIDSANEELMRFRKLRQSLKEGVY